MQGRSDHHTAQIWPSLPQSVAVGQHGFLISSVSEILLSCLAISTRANDSLSFGSPSSRVYNLNYFINIFWPGLLRESRIKGWGHIRENELSCTVAQMQETGAKQSLCLEVVFWISYPHVRCGGRIPGLSCKEKGIDGFQFSEIREKCHQVVSTTPVPLCTIQAPASNLLCRRGWMHLLIELQNC